MDQIKSWAFSVCIASICGSILNIFVPEGSLQKTFKCVISIFFLCVVISPILNIDVSDLFNQEKIYLNAEYVYEENEFEKISIKAFEENLIYETEKLLAEKEVDFADLSINVNISEDGGIDISEFNITFDREGNFDSLKNEIKEKIGIEPEIIISGVNENGNH